MRPALLLGNMTDLERLDLFQELVDGGVVGGVELVARDAEVELVPERRVVSEVDAEEFLQGRVPVFARFPARLADVVELEHRLHQVVVAVGGRRRRHVALPPPLAPDGHQVVRPVDGGVQLGGGHGGQRGLAGPVVGLLQVPLSERVLDAGVAGRLRASSHGDARLHVEHQHHRHHHQPRHHPDHQPFLELHPGAVTVGRRPLRTRIYPNERQRSFRVVLPCGRLSPPVYLSSLPSLTHARYQGTPPPLQRVIRGSCRRRGGREGSKEHMCGAPVDPSPGVLLL